VAQMVRVAAAGRDWTCKMAGHQPWSGL